MKSKAKKAKSKTSDDPYLDVAWKQHGHVCYLYSQFADERPVMLFDIQEQRVYAYPYREFAADLSERSQVSLAQQYRAACRAGEMVVFIRDNARQRLVSYSLPIE